MIDPGGVVQSQVVETADGALRLVLNASQSQQTQSSRFLNERFGSGVQHIAFGTDDIFATVEHLKRNGVDLLPIPENYYDDLEVRVDLDAAQIERLRADNILYDRDGETAYFQAYTSGTRQRSLLRNRRATRLHGLRCRQRAHSAGSAVAAGANDFILAARSCHSHSAR